MEAIGTRKLFFPPALPAFVRAGANNLLGVSTLEKVKVQFPTGWYLLKAWLHLVIAEAGVTPKAVFMRPAR